MGKTIPLVQSNRQNPVQRDAVKHFRGFQGIRRSFQLDACLHREIGARILKDGRVPQISPFSLWAAFLTNQLILSQNILIISLM